LHDILGNFALDFRLFGAFGQLSVLDCTELIVSLLQHLLETLIETLEQRGTTGQHDVLVEFGTVLSGARKNSLIHDFVERLNIILVEEFRMEVHFRGEEALVAHVHGDHIAFGVLVHVALKLGGLDPVAIIVLLLLVKFGVLLLQVLAHVTILFLNASSLLIVTFLTTVSKRLLDVISHGTASHRNALDAGANDVRVTHWEDMSHTITSVDDCACHVRVGESDFGRSVLSSFADLSIEGKCSLYTNEQTFNIESLEHDLSHLLTVLGRVHWRFSEDESMFFRFATQVLMHRLVPVLLDVFPVSDLTFG